jgi:hypothetical protein
MGGREEIRFMGKIPWQSKAIDAARQASVAVYRFGCNQHFERVGGGGKLSILPATISSCARHGLCKQNRCIDKPTSRNIEVIGKLVGKIGRRYRWLQLKLAGAKIAYGVQIHGKLLSGDASGLECDAAYFLEGVRLVIATSPSGKPGRLRIGNASFFNFFAVIDCHDSIDIGSHVAIGPHCYIGDFDHAVDRAQGSGDERPRR